MFNIKVPFNVLGIYSKDFKPLNFKLLQAMRAVWKSMDAPSLRMWIRDYICLKGKKTKKDFVKLWEPNINIIKDGNVSFA